MPEEDFIIAVFCCVDDLLQSAPELLGICRRGFAPRLCGSEAVTMEVVVGEFLVMDSDKAVWGHFRRHWQCLFPGLGSRSVFVRQAANLCSSGRGSRPCCHAGWRAGVTPSPHRGLPSASVPLRKGRAVPALQRGGRLRPLRLQGCHRWAWPWPRGGREPDAAPAWDGSREDHGCAGPRG